MDLIRIRGGRGLRGTVRVSGSKNGALPILAASLLVDGPIVLRNMPRLTDVENLINQDINVLILLAKDLTTIGPALETAANAGVPVIAYDRLVEDENVLYITFDNVGVGAAEATAMFDKVPTGTYVLIKGDPGDPNASTFLPQGWDDAGLQEKNCRLLEAFTARLNELRTSERFDRNLPTVLAAHVGVRGSVLPSLFRLTEQEDVLLSEDALPSDLDYVALGHVHRPQTLGGFSHVRYSGSLDRMDLGEQDDGKSVVVFDLGPEGLRDEQFSRRE